MSSEKENNIVSLSGQPIYHHEEPSPFKMPEGEEFIEEISNHIEQHLGPISSVLHELVSDTVHIDVHVVPPNDRYNGVRLVTSGMSDLPMSVPEGRGRPEYAELVVTLPPYWKLDDNSFEDESWYWPIRLIKSLARLPHKYDTWLGYGHTIPNGDPEQPYAKNTSFTGAIVLPPLTTPSGFSQLTIPGVKDIQFYAVVPLYKEEMELKLRKGTDELLDRFDHKDIDDHINLERKNVGKRSIWPFG